MQDIFFITISLSERGFSIDWVGMYLTIEAPVFWGTLAVVSALRVRKLVRDRLRRKNQQKAYGGWEEVPAEENLVW